MWTALLEARSNTSPEALETLFATYWRPIYSVVRLRWNQPHENAKDLTQEFFLNLIERSFLSEIDPSKGRFRNFLKAALKNFMLNQKRDTARIKRGGKLRGVSIEALPLEPPAADSDPEALFDQMWAQNLLARAIESTEKTLGEKDHRTWFEALRILNLDGEAADAPTYKQVASDLNIPERTVKKALEGARRALRSAILTEIRQYAISESEVREELESLFRTL